MSELKELKESIFSPLTIKEDEDPITKTKRMRVIGQVQEAETVNINRRLYPRSVLEEALSVFGEKVTSGRAFGQPDHPIFGGALKDTSHLVTRLWWDEDVDPEIRRPSNRLMAEVQLFNTPAGQVIQEIIRGGGKPGFSSRGIGRGVPFKTKLPGSDEEVEVEKIEKGFKLEAFDFAIDPSFPNAAIRKVIESVQHNTVTSPKEASMDKLDEKKVVEEQPAPPEGEEAPPEKEPEKEPVDEKDAEIERLSGALAAIIDALKEAGLIPAEPEGEEEPAPEEEPPASPKESVDPEITSALHLLRRKNEELEKQQKAIAATLKKQEAQAYLFEATKNEVFGQVLRNRLKDCATKEDVEKRLSDYRDFAKLTLDENVRALKTKGRPARMDESENSEADIAEIKAQAKGIAEMKG